MFVFLLLLTGALFAACSLLTAEVLARRREVGYLRSRLAAAANKGAPLDDMGRADAVRKLREVAVERAARGDAYAGHFAGGILAHAEKLESEARHEA